MSHKAVKSALIGHTGYVGTTLRRQTVFTDHFNSSNSADMRGHDYDLVVCAGAPATKWQINQNPQLDLENLQTLMSNLDTLRAREFVLISTIDVYGPRRGVDEQTVIDPSDLDAYGRHRYTLEQFVRETFRRALIVRLPGLFGAGLKKNFIFDLMQTGRSPWTHKDSYFQFYDMQNLWQDVSMARARELMLVNFATEPVCAAEVATECFGIPFDTITEKPPVNYDMRTIYAADHYMMSKSDVLSRIRAFTRSV